MCIMTVKNVDLVPKKVSDGLKDVLGLSVGESIIRFLADEITQMFRELSEHRSMTEVKARSILARREERLLVKLSDLVSNDDLVIDVYAILRSVMEGHFDSQRGKKYL